MSRKTRTFLFFLFLALFFGAAPAIIAYSQGYRVDWDSKRIVKTGAFSFEPRPAPVELFLDGKRKKRSNFVFQNIFIGNLLPKHYSVEITKEGYYTWRKILPIAPKLVTEVKNLMLFPTRGVTLEIADDVHNFFFSPSGKRIVLVKHNSVPQLYVYETEAKTEKFLFQAVSSLGEFALSNIQWNKDSTRFLFSQGGYRPKESERNPATNRTATPEFIETWTLINAGAWQAETLDLSHAIENSKDFKLYTEKLSTPHVGHFRWDTDNPSRLFFTVGGVEQDKTHILFSYDADSGKLSKPYAYDVLQYTILGNSILYISSRLGTVHMIDRTSDNVSQVLFNRAFDAQTDSEITFFTSPRLAISVDGSLHLFDERGNSLDRTIENIDDAIPSFDNKKLLLRGESNLRVYWLQDVHIQPFHDAGDLEEVYRSPKEIFDAVWFSKDNEHIIFTDSDTIQVMELDGRGQRNRHVLTSRKAEKLFYEREENTLYFLSTSTLYAISLK